MIKKVSVMALTLRKLACLKTKLVKNPKNAPIVRETTPSSMNCTSTVNNVPTVNSTDYRLTMVLNRMMQTISFTIPSPKITEKSLGCFE